MSLSIIPSIIIPSEDNDMLVKKDMMTICGGISPINEDSSMWFSVIYEIWNWNIDQVNKDLNRCINNLDLEDLYIEKIEKIENAIQIFGIYLKESPHISGYIAQLVKNNLETFLSMKKKQLEEKMKKIEEKKIALIKRMENFYEYKEITLEFVEKEKKEIYNETLAIKKMGATKEILKQIGKEIYNIHEHIKHIKHIKY